MSRGELDVFFDADIEAFQTVLEPPNRALLVHRFPLGLPQ